MPSPRTTVEYHPHRVTTLHDRALLLTEDNPSPVVLRTELHYTEVDPYAVRLSLSAPGADLSWDLSRESLLAGVRRHEGLGDVAIWPVAPPSGPPRVRIRLGRPGNCAVLDTERESIATWLDTTLRLVPRGREEAYIDWNAVITRLFQGA
ncbi:SsgA family sporulation/cell division regulator [Streptomyces sp. VRA16 Mangrove soil]|uniref:SsgA family sporulation/cell division regulator n=1 Tax=Streptomyces sp. VRA16 Mangrove soil TaxID=2817434 RepID=UPI001A9F1462|nr:SsgA family sporulation/cell division regulator [Streptomyces sp. VRA16 Mangrove soil]MBO1330508.1 SsgA family sporulation/cell division regulator [Streptomyces sp. VRA16 Mangrove soil]